MNNFGLKIHFTSWGTSVRGVEDEGRKKGKRKEKKKRTEEREVKRKMEDRGAIPEFWKSV